MSLVNQGEISGGPSSQPVKRKRGRPRKDPSLKHIGAAHASPGSGGLKVHLPQRADRTVSIESMVGQAVTGVVEATFDSGYLLSIRIGESNTNLRGVVFKPGHYVPITAENDVAPHVQLIRRNDHFTVENQGWSGGQNLAMQTAPVVPSKRKYAPRKAAPSVPPAGVGSYELPAVSSPCGLQTSDHADKEVHMAETLSMFPPADQIFVTAQPHSSHQVAAGQDDDGSFNEGTMVGQEEKPKSMVLTDVDTSGSSQTSDINIDVGKEALKSSAEDSGIVSKQETGNPNEPFSIESLQTGNPNEPFSIESLPTASLGTPLFSYGSGRMTELLQALQTEVQIAEPQTSATQVDFHEIMTKDSDPDNEASVP